MDVNGAERSVVTTCTTLFFAPYIIWLLINCEFGWPPHRPPSNTPAKTARAGKSGHLVASFFFLFLPCSFFNFDPSFPLFFCFFQLFLLLLTFPLPLLLLLPFGKVYTWLLLLLPPSLLHSSPARSSPPSPRNSSEIIEQCLFFHMASSGLLTWPSLQAY